MTATRTALLFLALPLAVAACSKGPEKVAAKPAPQPSAPAHDPHGGMGGMDMNGRMPNDAIHGGMPSPHGQQNPTGVAEMLASGEVELAGEYAGVAEGFLFVSTRDADSDSPGYTTKISVAAGSRNAAGNQVVPFTVGTGDFFMGTPPGDTFNLKVQYDHDGMVNMGGEAGGTGTVYVPATKGQTGISVTIEKKD